MFKRRRLENLYKIIAKVNEEYTQEQMICAVETTVEQILINEIHPSKIILCLNYIGSMYKLEIDPIEVLRNAALENRKSFKDSLIAKQKKETPCQN